MTLAELYHQMELDHIRRFVAEGQVEHLHLDFKTVAREPFGRDDRKNLAIALSGFANSDGGLVVWGIDCRPAEDGTDCASKLCPIQRLSALLSSLYSTTGEAVNPDVSGVQHRTIESAPDEGFAVTLVPPSDRGPHMAKCGEDRYYKRSGSRFIKLEHFDIEDMFGRRAKPALEVYYRIVGFGTDGASTNVKILIGLKNGVRGTARDLFLALDPATPFSVDYSGLDGNHNHGLRVLPHGPGPTEWLFGGRPDVALHPGMKYEVTAISTKVETVKRVHPDITVRYKVAAAESPLREDILMIPGAEIVSTMFPKVS